MTIDGSVSVSGNCDGGTTVAFDAKVHNQRPGLALVNGNVYVSWASHGDQGKYHGWVVAFNASTLAKASVWNSSPNSVQGDGSCRGGIWMSGGAPAADAANNLYLMTGNGLLDANNGGSDY